MTSGLRVFKLFLAAAMTAGLSTAHAENGVTDKEIHIGASYPMTLEIVKDMVAAMQTGANAYYKKINDAGGVNGRKIKFTVLDDGYEPKRSKENAEEILVKQKAFAMVGGTGAAGISSMLPVLEKEKAPIIFPYAGAGFMYKPVKKVIFPLTTSLESQAQELVDYFVKERKFTKFGVFYQDDVGSSAGRDGVVKALAAHNLKLVRSSSHARFEKDYSKNVDELARAGVEVVILSSNSGPCADFVSASIGKGFNPIYGGLLGTSIPLLERKVKGNYEVVVTELLPLPGITSLPLLEDFKKDVPDLKDPALASRGFFGYVGARLFVEALKKAGPDLTRDKLTAALESMKDYDLGGIKVNITPESHQAVTKSFIYTLKNGQVTFNK